MRKRLHNQIISNIRGTGMNITEEGDIQYFLEVNIKRKKDGTVHLTQPHLIEAILKDLWMTGEGVKGGASLIGHPRV
jgi:hypothetical protein